MSGTPNLPRGAANPGYVVSGLSPLRRQSPPPGDLGVKSIRSETVQSPKSPSGGFRGKMLAVTQLMSIL